MEVTRVYIYVEIHIPAEGKDAEQSPTKLRDEHLLECFSCTTAVEGTASSWGEAEQMVFSDPGLGE